MIKQTLHPAHCRCPKCNPRHPGPGRLAQFALVFGVGAIGLGMIAVAALSLFLTR